jgi:hypothetical protein
VTDKKNKSATIDYTCYLDSAQWRRYFFNLDKADGVDIANISDISITIVPASDKIEDPVYLDGVELAYAVVNSNPAKPFDIRLSALNDVSICKITFDALDGVHRYDIRYSAKPISLQSDFENCLPSDKMFFANGSGQEVFFLPLPGAGRYYVGVQSIDSMGQRSRVESVGPVTVKAQDAYKTLDDFERPGLASDTIIYPAHKGYTLSISGERISNGRGVLKAQFHKVPSDPWDYIELEFRKLLDVRAYRYLKMNVFGEDAIIAKLYNTKEMQEEIGVLRGLKKDAWNELVFDIAAMPGDKCDKSRVTKLLLFIAPGRSASGTMYIDNIRLDN